MKRILVLIICVFFLLLSAAIFPVNATIEKEYEGSKYFGNNLALQFKIRLTIEANNSLEQNETYKAYFFLDAYVNNSYFDGVFFEHPQIQMWGNNTVAYFNDDAFYPMVWLNVINRNNGYFEITPLKSPPESYPSDLRLYPVVTIRSQGINHGYGNLNYTWGGINEIEPLLVTVNGKNANITPYDVGNVLLWVGIIVIILVIVVMIGFLLRRKK